MGAIGTGKSFLSSVAVCYLLYKLGCLKDPQAFYGLSPNDPIFLMNMSVNEEHARNIIFSAIKARIDNSPWFIKRFKYDSKLTTELRFPNYIYVIPGNSSESFFEGYAIFGGVIDEADNHDRTPERDAAEEGYQAIKTRVESRFGDNGLVIVIGSPKVVDGFLSRRHDDGIREMEDRGKKSKTYAIRVPYWESPNTAVHDYSGKTFNFRGTEIPIEHEEAFRRDPERSMRDLAAIPSQAMEPFFSQPEAISKMVTDIPNPIVKDSKGEDTMKFHEWFGAPDRKERVIHVDLGINKKGGDAAGLAMGSIDDVVEIDGMRLPHIRMDLIMRITAPPLGEIKISDIRKVIYKLRDLGFNIGYVSFDGWQSIDSIQQLNSKGIKAEIVSIDRTTKAYEAFKEAVYEERISYYHHPTLIKEAQSLDLVNGDKVDHPPGGSKDVSDAVAGVVLRLATTSPRLLRKAPKSMVGLRRISSRMNKDGDLTAE